MYWLQRPPYLRWAAALALVVAAFLWDLRPPATTSHPFLAGPVAAGEPIPAGSIEWRQVPTGLLPSPDLSRPVAGTDLPAGVPLLDPMLGDRVAVPDDWWEVPVAVGAHAAVGDHVLLVVVDPPTTVAGLVVSAQQGDPYSLDYVPASVAVPAEAAPLVAAAAAGGTLVTAVRSDRGAAAEQ